MQICDILRLWNGRSMSNYFAYASTGTIITSTLSQPNKWCCTCAAAKSPRLRLRTQNWDKFINLNVPSFYRARTSATVLHLHLKASPQRTETNSSSTWTYHHFIVTEQEHPHFASKISSHHTQKKFINVQSFHFIVTKQVLLHLCFASEKRHLNIVTSCTEQVHQCTIIYYIQTTG